MGEGWMILLTDNGSRRPAAWRTLVTLSASLSKRVGAAIHPVSMLQSDQVSATLPGGPPPRVMRSFLETCLAEGERRFLVLPLFLGPSGAVTRYLQSLVEELRADFPDLRVKVAPFLFDAAEGEGELEEILEEHVGQVVREKGLHRPAVVVVDHGSPSSEVTAVRDLLAARLGTRLANQVQSVSPASMERRDGDEYAFNEPLLAGRLRDQDLAGTPVVLALLFLSPGRHAGPGGDIDEIVEASLQTRRDRPVYRTRLLSEHPRLVDLLQRRLEAIRPGA